MQIPNPTYYKRLQLRNNEATYYFDNMTNFNRWLDEVEANARGNRRYTDNGREAYDSFNTPTAIQSNIRYQGESWYGTTDYNLVTGDMATFLFNTQLETFVQRLKSRTAVVSQVDIDQRKKIQFTQQEIGIFSFDLASLGLVPVYYFYSKLLDMEVSGDKVVVKKNSAGEEVFDSKGNKVFVHIYQQEIKKHYVEFNAKQNGYFSNILGRVVEKEELMLNQQTNQFYYPFKPEIPEHEVERLHKLNPDGSKKFITNFKKCYVHLPKIKQSLPRFDIIVGVGFVSGGVDAVNQLPYNAMGAITLAEKLSASGINYRIVVAFANRWRGKEVFSFVSAKKDGEVFDKNRMATMMADGRYIRGQGFRADIAMLYDANFGDDISTSIGSAVRDINLYRGRYMEYLQNSTDPDDLRASTNPASKIVFASAMTEQEAEQQFNNAIEQITTGRIP